MNHLGKSENVSSDYFFSRQGSIWGTAVWKRTVMNRSFLYYKDPYVMELLKQRTRRNPIAWKRLCAYGQQDKYEGHVAGAEFWYEFDMYAQNRLQIVPKYNLVSNIGCDKDSMHMDDIKQLPKGFRRVLNMDTYELEFPLKHPEYVMPDIEYEKRRNRIMAYNYPLVSAYRRVERVVLKIVNGDVDYVIKKILSRIKKEKVDER